MSKKSPVQFYRERRPVGGGKCYTLGGWRWRLKAGNNQIVATSGEAYSCKSKCVRAFSTVGKLAAKAIAMRTQRP